MAWWIGIGTLAAFGALCAVWAVFGLCFSCGRGGALVCLCHSSRKEMALILRYRWLRGMGLISCPLLLCGSTLSEAEQAAVLRKYPGIEFCSLDALPSRLEVERNRLG